MRVSVSSVKAACIRIPRALIDDLAQILTYTQYSSIERGNVISFYNLAMSDN